jgi:hypothetical protein
VVSGLEHWTAIQIRELQLQPALDLTVGVNAFRGINRVPLEIDVAALRRTRPYLISCTTDTTNDVCKAKLFEIAVRSRQLCGDLARAALVCLASDNTASKLQTDIDDVWGASNTTLVFGLSDLHAWAALPSAEPNRDSLISWLEQ